MGFIGAAVCVSLKSESAEQEREDHGAYHIQPEEYEFSAAVARYWASFAALHEPHADVPWPAYDKQTEPVLVIGDVNGSVGSRTFHVVNQFRSSKCDFWDAQFAKTSTTVIL